MSGYGLLLAQILSSPTIWKKLPQAIRFNDLTNSMWHGTPDEAWAHSQIGVYDRIPSWPTVSVARFSGKKSRRRLPTLRQTERRQGGLIDCRGDRQSMVSLKSCQRLPRFRSENSIDLSDVITVTLQLALHVHDHLIGRQISVAVNGPIIRIVSVRIVPPGRIPITPYSSTTTRRSQR